MIVKHLGGNILSRWTDFLTADDEKAWHEREAEFAHDLTTPAEVIVRWNEGWHCLFGALKTLTEVDLSKEIFIRNMGHTVVGAVDRQLAHHLPHEAGGVYRQASVRRRLAVAVHPPGPVGSS